MHREGQHIFFQSVDFLRFSDEMLTICFLAVPAAGSSVRSHPKNVTTISLSPEEVQHAIHVVNIGQSLASPSI